MKLTISKSKNAASLYVTKSIYVNGKHTSRVVEKLGTMAELEQKLNGQDPIAWAKSYIQELNRKEKEGRRDVLVKYSPAKPMEKDTQHTYNGGYLFLQQLYYQLGLDQICEEMTAKYKFSFDLNGILSRLLYTRMLFPSSKRAACELSKQFLEPPTFSLHQVYRSLEVLAKETDFMQAALYQNSLRMTKRKTGLLFYDCTNYFFEIEQADGDKQYGLGKDHKPNPLIQMGLFMDADGIPLAFGMYPGNQNEQKTMRPLEEKILSDFHLSRFVVCTDAGLSSVANKQFNNRFERSFLTTQSLKKLKGHLKAWALDPQGWHLSGSKKTYCLTDLDEAQAHDLIFYKERWIKENGLEERLIVTYSIKYRNYHRTLRTEQVQRAQKAVDQNPTPIGRPRQTDYKRFISQTHCTEDGELAETVYGIDREKIQQEAMFDGFYAVCTTLEDDPSFILAANKRRWEIEACFRIMKSEFKARPVYLSRDDRIKAHFTTCFIALLLYRLLEQKCASVASDQTQVTCRKLLGTLRDMNFYEIKGEGYIPTYTRTDMTDMLHGAFGFRTDYQIVPGREMKKIFKQTKG